MSPLCDSIRAPARKKKIDVCSHEGKQVAPRTQKREQKNLDHMGCLKTNNLATLVLDGERATRTNLDRTGSPKASELVAPMLGRERANRKSLHIIFLKADELVLARKKNVNRKKICITFQGLLE